MKTNRSDSSRRQFLQSAGLLAVLAPFARLRLPGSNILKPPRLRPGDTIGLINPAGATFETTDIKIVEETLAALGLGFKLGRHVLDRYGYLAGTDEHRAEDVNEMFGDASVAGILTVRGGWGCARILPLLDYDLIARHPKVLMGYSDVTALLVGIYAKTGMVTFHGPVGISTWNNFSTTYVREVLMEGQAVTFRNPVNLGDNLAQTQDRVQTITGGTTRGRLAGGNLSVLCGIVGSAYLPDWKDHILFVEDDGEKIYRIDRMLTQLQLAGILKTVTGFIFGKCTKCEPGDDYGSLTLEEVLKDHIKPLGVPAWYGAMIGHIENKFTIPIGIEAEIDADQGTIRMLEPAVE